MSAKWKRVVVSIEDKLAALRCVDRGETLNTVCLDYDVLAGRVGDGRRNRQKLE